MAWNTMFQRDYDRDKRSISFLASFYLGIPLAVCATRNSRGWDAICAELTACFTAKPDRFEVVCPAFDSEIVFPFAEPLCIRHLEFFTICNLQTRLAARGIDVGPNDLDNVIWICPTGTVLLIGKFAIDSKHIEDVAWFKDEFFEKHYAELSLLFSEVSETIIERFPSDVLTSALISKRYLVRCQKGIEARKQYLELTANQPKTSDVSVSDLLEQHPDMHRTLDDVLIDIYYIDYNSPQSGPTTKVEFVYSLVPQNEPPNVLIIAIGYSSWVTVLWLQKFLSDQLGDLQLSLISHHDIRSETASDLKTLLVFSMQLISEATPLSIHLRREFVTCLENFWAANKMDNQIAQMKDQLSTLEAMFSQIEDTNREGRNIKLALAGTILAVISLAGVIQSLIDASTKTPGELPYVGMGVGVAFIVISAVLLLPVNRLANARERMAIRLRRIFDQPAQ